jgi:ABC-type Fe3+-siderophore transport system permease subunit
MVAIPAWVWRFGLIVRALIAGVALGMFVALLVSCARNSMQI